MAENITSKYPLLFPPEKVFLYENKIIYHKEKVREISFKEIAEIKVQPLIIWMTGGNLYFLFGRKIPAPDPNKPKPFGWGWIYYKINNINIILNTGKKIKLHNVSVSGSDKFLNMAKSFNSNIVVSKISMSMFNANNVAGLVSTRNFMLIPIIFAFIFIIIIFYFLYFYKK